MNDTSPPALTTHLHGVGRVPAVLAQELKPGDQIMYNDNGMAQAVKIESVSPKFVVIFEVDTDTGQEYQRRVPEKEPMARVAQEDRRRLGHDAPASHYRAQIKPPTGGLDWITVSHGATIREAVEGVTASGHCFSYFDSVMLDRHGIGWTRENPYGRSASIEAMIGGQTLTAPDGHRFRILPPSSN